MFNVTEIKGFKILTSRMEKFYGAGLGIFVRAGARIERKRVKGIAHFTEHMLFKGTKNMSYKSIKREIEGRGGMLNGYTSQEITAYYAHFLKSNLEITFKILADMVSCPLFLEREIEKERKVIMEEIKMYNDLPHFRALSLLENILWPGHSLGEDVIGREDTVGAVMRNDLEEFRKRYYRPSSMLICCVGDFKEQEALDLIGRNIPTGSKQTARIVFSPPGVLKGTKIAVEKKNLDQVHLCVGFRSISYRCERRLAAELIHIVMGANMSSRLFEEVREKRGICYDISTEVKKYYDTGMFVIHCGLDDKYLVRAFTCILRELMKIKNKTIPGRELARAKDYLMGQMAMSVEKPQGRLFYLADSYLALGRVYDMRAMEEELKKISVSDLKELAGEIFDFTSMRVACVGREDDLYSRIEYVMDKETGK